jgi:hypothetical protein
MQHAQFMHGTIFKSWKLWSWKPFYRWVNFNPISANWKAWNTISFLICPSRVPWDVQRFTLIMCQTTECSALFLAVRAACAQAAESHDYAVRVPHRPHRNGASMRHMPIYAATGLLLGASFKEQSNDRTKLASTGHATVDKCRSRYI